MVQYPLCKKLPDLCIGLLKIFINLRCHPRKARGGGLGWRYLCLGRSTLYLHHSETSQLSGIIEDIAAGCPCGVIYVLP